MAKTGIDQDALIAMFANASAKSSEQLRQAVHDATLGALRGRELTLQNMRAVLKTVSQAAGAAATQQPAAGVDVESMLEQAVEGIDSALLQAVEANRVALQQFVAQGADLQEKHLKKALDDLEKLEDMMLGTLGKAAESAGAPLAGPWSAVLDKMKLSGTQTGAQASATVSQLGEQMRDAVRASRASSLRAAQTLAESYSALVSGVLIGMSDAMRSGSGAGRGGTASKSSSSRRR